jgi:monoamine oxidase
MERIYDVIIVGGGLSGMAIAQSLNNNDDSSNNMKNSWLLLEARSVLGGRLLNDDSSDMIDLGGAWIWPRAQPKMQRLVKELQLATFTQPDDPSSTRIDGGAAQVIHQLAQQLPSEKLQLNSPVISCILNMDSNIVQLVTATANDGEEKNFYSRRVVFAIPPKLVEKHIQFQPPLSSRKCQAMAACHTWMAGVTKIALVYPERFWDLNYSNMGLSPSFKNKAPAFQVYDSSTFDDSIAALTFFCLATRSSSHTTPSSSSGASQESDDEILAQQVARQMNRLWTQLSQTQAAERVGQYTRYCVQRWPEVKYVSENDKPDKIQPHPQPDPVLAQVEWEGRLEFAGSETDQRDPGVMEGAIGAAHRVVQSLQATRNEWCSKK